MAEVMQKFGRIPDIDAAASGEDVWDGEGAYAWPAAATTMNISSSDATDTAAGDGAQTARIFGLDANYAETSVDMGMSGQSGVEISTDFLRVYRAYALTVGTDGVNAGDIWIGTGTITDGVPAVKYAGILAGLGQTLMSVYTVPVSLADGEAINGGKIIRWYGTVGAGQAAYATIALQTRELGGSWRTRRVSGIGEGGGVDETFSQGLDVPAKTDIRVRVLHNGVINSAICAGFDIDFNTSL